MKIKHYLLLAAEPGDTGSGLVDRGDNLGDDDSDLDPDAPDADQVAADAAAAALEAELAAEKAEEGDETDTKKAKKEGRIPESRHKAILEAERAKRADLERQLAQYQSGQQVASINTEITALEDSVAKMDLEHAELLTDGKLEAAAALMSKIRKAERDMSEAKGDMKIQAAEARATERARYNIALERIESAYPELNPDHDDFSDDTMSEVVELKEAYQLKGLTPTAALQKAVKLLVEPRTTKQEVATTSTPRVDEKSVAAERKTAAVDKAIKTAAKIPANLSKTGQDGDKLGGGKLDAKAVMAMSQKEFSKLNEADLAMMRGDTI